jgi:hypothetical protein
MTIYGYYFVPGASAQMIRTGYTPIECSAETVVTSGKITGKVTLPSTARTGYWNLKVTNPDGQSGIKTNAFYIY